MIHFVITNKYNGLEIYHLSRIRRKQIKTNRFPESLKIEIHKMYNRRMKKTIKNINDILK